MKRCPICAESVQDAAVKCRFCGEVLGGPSDSVLAQIAGSEVKLSRLLVDLPGYGRRFHEILREPIGYFRRLNYGDGRALRSAIAFMLQGIMLSFVLVTLGSVAPESLRNYLLLEGSLPLTNYARRVRELREVLPPAVAEHWFDHKELVLVLRTLPEDRFRRLVSRLRELTERSPDVLEAAIRPPAYLADAFGGRMRVWVLFSALDPGTGTRLAEMHQALRPLGTLRRYELKPHIDFLLRSALLWYLACALVSVLMRNRVGPGDQHAPFLAGACLVGFLGPVSQTFVTLLSIAETAYVTHDLPRYVETVSQLFLDGRPVGTPGTPVQVGFSDLLAFTFGRHLVLLTSAGLAMAALVAALRTAYGVSRGRALAVAITGVGIGLLGMQAVGDLLVFLLAPTGLL
jgi:hypothetical protein